jgi:tryptophan-rich sensory protein
LAKRRLPLLQPNTDGGSDDPVRPVWQWVVFGAAAIFVAWVPLSALVGAVAARIFSRASDPVALGRAALMTTIAYALELAVGALSGGYLIGRWGPGTARVRVAALAGLAAAAGLAVAAIASGASLSGGTIGLVFVALWSPLTAALGGLLGLRRRPRLG